MTQKVDEAANFDKCHPDCARWDKIDLAWEGISHEMKESRSWLNSFETI
jgi:hypothetical protein